MAVSKPLYIDQTFYDAEGERRGLGVLLTPSAAGTARSGVLGPAPAITLSGNTVQVGPCGVAIGTAKGVYLTGLDSVTAAEGTVGVADATYSRMDRIVLEVLDPGNGSGGTDRKGRLRVIPGTAAAIPGLPPLPSLALHLGSVLTPKSSSGQPSVVAADCKFTATAGAPVPVRNETERGELLKYEGAQALRLDSPGRSIDTVVNGAWVPGGSAKQPITLTSLYTPDPPREDKLAQEPPSYYRAGRRVHLSGVASNTDTIAFSGGTVYGLGSLPPLFRPAYPEYFSLEVAFIPCRLWVRPDGQIYFMFPNAISTLGPRVGKFSLSGISFDAA